MTLKELRKEKGLTQREAAAYLDISTRTFQAYETDFAKQTGLTYQYILDRLRQYGYIDEHSGLLTVDAIRDKCLRVFEKYPVDYCYLFGSYAKGRATETSDVDLLVSTDLTGLRFYELTESLREALKKQVDLLDQRQITGNLPLLHEILKDGIKIYG